MAGNVQKKLSIGIHPLSYLGVNAESPPNSVLLQNQDPTPSDWQNFIIGDIWINENGSPNPPNPRIWMLGAIARQSATWILIASGSGDVSTLTGNSGGAVSPLLGNINVVGDGTTINIVGNPGTHTLTVSAVGTGVVSSFVTDSGTAIPILGVIDLFAQTQAGGSVRFSASTNVIRLNTTDAGNNTFVGLMSGNTTKTGTTNTGFGYQTLLNLSSGSSNTSIGVGGGLNITTGGLNSAIGAGTLQNLTTGSYNIALGQASGLNYTGAESSNILIGNAGVLGESHVMRLGTDGSGNGQVNTTYIAGAVTMAESLIVTTSISTINGGISAGDTEANSNPADLNMIKSRSGGVVHSGDSLGAIQFLGNDGTNAAVQGARILGVVSGAPALNSIPTLLSFWTTPVGGGFTQRMSIPAAGGVIITAADSGTTLTVNGTGIAIEAAGGSIQAADNLYTAGDDGTGAASTISFTNSNSTTISTGTGTIKMSTANNANSSAWIKIYIGTTAYFIPAFTTNAP